MKRDYYSDPFHPRTTGLSVTIWIGTKENGGQPRLWVADNGKYYPVHFSARMSRHPEVSKWIKMHIKALNDYWQGTIDTAELVEKAMRRK